MTKITDGIKAYEIEMKLWDEDHFCTDDMTADIIDYKRIKEYADGFFYLVDDAEDTVEWVRAWEQYGDVFPEELEDAKAEGERIAIIEKIPTPKLP